MAHRNTLWRPEALPSRAGFYVLARYTSDLGKPLREVLQGEDGKARHFEGEEAAYEHAEAINGPEPAEEIVLSDVEASQLEKVASWPEGKVARNLHTVLLRLEHKGMVKSQAEPNTRGMDRWTITEAGQEYLNKERKD